MIAITDMEQENYQWENDPRIKRKAGGTTLLLFSAVVAMLFLFAMTPPNPPYTDPGGMEIVLGTDAIGMNEVFEPVKSGAPNDNAQEEEEQPVAAQPDVADKPAEILTSDIPDAPEVKADPKPAIKPVTEKPKVEKPVENTKPAENPQPKSNPNFEFKKNPGSGQGQGSGAGSDPNGTVYSKGTGWTPGDQGDPNGDPNSKTFTGTDGSGTGWSLEGGSLKSLNVRHIETQKSGKVVVKIVVDGSGKVVEALPGQRGSTLTDAIILEHCRKMALDNAKFSENADKPRREGYLTFVFKVE